MLPATNSPAPLFSLPDETGELRTLQGEKGHWVLLYFYPKDDTPGCTIEACALRDHWQELQKHNCTVFGVSADETQSHAAFKEKFHLPFHLLADTKKTVIQAYGVWQEKLTYGKKTMGIVRTSFLIDPEGTIAKVYGKVDPNVHAKTVLVDLAALQTP